MLKFPIPDMLLNSFSELKPEHLTEKDIKLLLMDLDNTIAKYHAASPSVSLRNWIDSLKRAGIEPFIYSNSRGDRAKRFADALSIEYINKAKKPQIKKLSELLKKKSDFFLIFVCKCGKVWHIKHGYKNIYIKTSILKIFVCFRETELKIKEDQDG